MMFVLNMSVADKWSMKEKELVQVIFFVMKIACDETFLFLKSAKRYSIKLSLNKL